MLELVVVNQTNTKIDDTVIERLTKEIYLRLNRLVKLPRDTQLSLAFVSNQQIQSLNQTYRQKDKVTDILSFTGDDEELGDLVLALEVLLEQAKQNQHSLSHEFCYLVIHGLLHLMGYDHESEEEAKEMFHIQDQVFASFQSESLESFLV